MELDLGVLVSESRLRRPGGLDGVLGAGWEQADNHGVRRLFFTPESLDLQADRGTALLSRDGNLVEEPIRSLPRIFHNLLVRPAPAGARVLRELNGRRGVSVFNETNRWDRTMLHEMLASAPDVAPSLPAAETDGPGLYACMSGRSSVRNGYFLSTADAPEVRYWHLGTGMRGAVSGDLSAAVRLLGEPETLAPRRLPGWPVGPGVPAEWRFYLHRDVTGQWVIGGEVVKYDALREPGRRERCWPMGFALEQCFGARAGAVGDRLRRLALQTANVLARFQPGCVHIAVDYWVTEDGQAVLADLSGRFRTEWLAKAGEHAALRRLSEHPLQFARMLAETGVGKLHVDFCRAGQ